MCGTFPPFCESLPRCAEPSRRFAGAFRGVRNLPVVFREPSAVCGTFPPYCESLPRCAGASRGFARAFRGVRNLLAVLREPSAVCGTFSRFQRYEKNQLKRNIPEIFALKKEKKFYKVNFTTSGVFEKMLFQRNFERFFYAFFNEQFQNIKSGRHIAKIQSAAFLRQSSRLGNCSGLQSC